MADNNYFINITCIQRLLCIIHVHVYSCSSWHCMSFNMRAKEWDQLARTLTKLDQSDGYLHHLTVIVTVVLTSSVPHKTSRQRERRMLQWHQQLGHWLQWSVSDLQIPSSPEQYCRCDEWDISEMSEQLNCNYCTFTNTLLNCIISINSSEKVCTTWLLVVKSFKSLT